MSKNIIFVGPMGAGKTTIGRLTAKSLGRPFYDSDREIERRTGVSIPVIFEHEQEEGFRNRESAMIEELCAKNNIVLATGGGAILREQNRRILKENGHVFYLCAPLEQLVARTAKDKNRPLLQTGNPEKTIENLLAIRDPLYRAAADSIIETDKMTVRQVVSHLLNLVSNLKL